MQIDLSRYAGFVGNNQMLAIYIVGLVFGTVFFLSRRNLWLVYIARGVMDTIAFLSLYNGWGM